MISLKKYLDALPDRPFEDCAPDPRDVLNAALKAYGSAVRAMGESSLEGCPALGAKLKQLLGTLSQSLLDGMDCEAIAGIGKEVEEQLRGWGSRADRHYQQKASEVKELLIVMAHTGESFAARDRRCAEQLNDVTKQLESIASLEDVTEIRASVEKSAGELKASVERMTLEGKEAIEQLAGQVTDYRARLEEAEETACCDPMTGLHNRIWIENQIERRIGSGARFCVAIVDIDGFKKVNDDHGHAAGDQLLRQFAAELQSATRSTDAIGRWGGDEFIVVLDSEPQEAPAQIDRLAVRICRSYKIEARDGERELSINASIGLAEYIPGETIKELLARADEAMYARKAICHAQMSDERHSPPTKEMTGPEPQFGSGERSKKMKSLVAEDDATNRKLLKTFLSRYGDCDVAIDGNEAVTAVRMARQNHASYDLVCMDLRMPQMDGQEAIREIRKQEAAAGVSKTVKIIVTTIHTDIDSIAGALLSRCNAYLAKPIDTAKLRSELMDLGLIQ
jgi:two-component system chemotaxis response regulator CheY